MSNSMKANKPSVAIYGLYKNHEKDVERFLHSVKEADEIILCDIGSTDCTNLYIRQFKEANPGVNLSTFKICVSPWRFDDARNTALSLVNPDIDLCISLDLNEYLMENWKDNLLGQWEDNVTRYGHGFQASESEETKAARIHCRLGYTWKLPVYEILEYNGEEVIKDLPEFTLYQETVSEIIPPSVLSLLEKSVSERKDQWMSWSHLASEYIHLERYEDAQLAIENALSIVNSNKPPLYQMKYQIFKSQNKVREALTYLNQAILLCSSNPTPFYFEKATYLKALGRNIEAYLTIKEAENDLQNDEAVQKLTNEIRKTLREEGVNL